MASPTAASPTAYYGCVTYCVMAESWAAIWPWFGLFDQSGPGGEGGGQFWKPRTVTPLVEERNVRDGEALRERATRILLT